MSECAAHFPEPKQLVANMCQSPGTKQPWTLFMRPPGGVAVGSVRVFVGTKELLLNVSE